MWSVWSAGPKGDFFVDESVQSGIGRTSLLPLTFGVAFADFDLDGVLDLVGVNGHVETSVQDVQPTVTYRQPPLLFRGLGAGRFADVSSQAGASLRRPDRRARPGRRRPRRRRPARPRRDRERRPGARLPERHRDAAQRRAAPFSPRTGRTAAPSARASSCDDGRQEARRRGLGRRRLPLGERPDDHDRPRLGREARRGRRPLAGRHDGVGEGPRARASTGGSRARPRSP